MSTRILIVGAGFYGATLAEQLSHFRNVEVRIIDSRSHVAGNAYSYIEKSTEIEVHKYGTHLFHTNNEEIWKYISRFTQFNNYQHKVITRYKDKFYNMPINLLTISSFYGKSFTPEEAKKLIFENGSNGEDAENLEERAISLIGRDLYQAFIEGYTWKQWQTHPRDLPAEIITRLPVRFNFDDRYFSDKYQGIPIDGYTAIFEKMLDRLNIKTNLNVDYFDLEPSDKKADFVVFSGPIDRFFQYKHGLLGWRTLDFEWEVHEGTDFQGALVINEADISVPYTRTHEYRHLHPERNYQSNKTIIAREFSRLAVETDEPYYPINSATDRIVLSKYRDEASRLNTTLFGGRLGRYQYLDMHMAIGAALKDARKIAENLSLIK